MNTLITTTRKTYHQRLLSDGVLTVDSKGVPSNADSSSKLSVLIAQRIAEQISVHKQNKALGQTSGAKFEQINMEFLKSTFPLLSDLRPGKWHVEKLGNRNSLKISGFSQYQHLSYLDNMIKTDARLAVAIGNDYIVSPDIVVYREPETDDEINRNTMIVDNRNATLTDIRASYNPLPILHATVSIKWTMRSDRAQNSRTEALGLIRNRKGHLPHIVVVTGEPMPSRIASLALGTGDIDCVYHFALYELMNAVGASGAEDASEMLNILIEGKRLKDISDLPMDLTV